MYNDIIEAYKQAEKIMDDLPEGADINTVANMALGKAIIKPKKKRRRKADPTLRAKVMRWCYNNQGVEMTSTQIARDITGEDEPEHHFKMQIGTILKDLGYGKRHSGAHRLWIIENEL